MTAQRASHYCSQTRATGRASRRSHARQLARWEAARASDPRSRFARGGDRKLREERFNVEVAATLATLAPARHRQSAVEAIVALQVTYDYLDLLAEQRVAHPERGHAPTRHAGRRVSPRPAFRRRARGKSSNKRGPLPTGAAPHNQARARELPAAKTVATVALNGAMRCAKAQSLCHAAARGETTEIESWAMRESAGTDLDWREYLAGAAASVLSLHALIAAAADDRTTHHDAGQIDAAYLSICALTMLDSLVDREHDLATGELHYVDLYGSAKLMTARLARLARDATSKARALPNAAHHVLTLAGVVAYYTSALAPDGTFPPSLTKPIRDELHRS